MNTQQYIALLKEPAGLHAVSLPELQSLADKHPYMAGLQMLVLKKQQLEEQEEAYINKLPLVALTVPDRTKLHAWVNTTIEAPAKEDLHHHVEQTLDEAVEEAEDTNETEALEHALHIEETVEEDVEPEVEEKEEAAVETVPEPEVTEPEPIIDEVELEAEPELIEETMEAESEAEEEVVEEEDEVPTEMPDLSALGAIAKIISPSKEKEPEAPTPPERNSFVGWLKQLDTQPQEAAKTDELDDIIKTGSYEAQLMKESAELARKDREQLEEAEQDDADSVAIASKARRSAEMVDDNVTETLAMILEMQKKYDKARAAYEKLKLRFPDKADYFQGKIDSIKNK